MKLIDLYEKLDSFDIKLQQHNKNRMIPTVESAIEIMIKTFGNKLKKK